MNFVALGWFFKWSLTGLNLEFYFSYISCHTKVKGPSLPDYLFLSRNRIVGFILFSTVFVLY